jgi:hypothetical protein
MLQDICRLPLDLITGLLTEFLQEPAMEGTLGHTLLTYAPRDGILLTSATHWIELQKLDVSEASLVQMVEAEYGIEESRVLNRALRSAGNNQDRRRAVASQFAKKYVQSSAPSAIYRSKGKKFKKKGKKGKY